MTWGGLPLWVTVIRWCAMYFIASNVAFLIWGYDAPKHWPSGAYWGLTYGAIWVALVFPSVYISFVIKHVLADRAKERRTEADT